MRRIGIRGVSQRAKHLARYAEWAGVSLALSHKTARKGLASVWRRVPFLMFPQRCSIINQKFREIFSRSSCCRKNRSKTRKSTVRGRWRKHRRVRLCRVNLVTWGFMGASNANAPARLHASPFWLFNLPRTVDLRVFAPDFRQDGLRLDARWGLGLRRRRSAGRPLSLLEASPTVHHGTGDGGLFQFARPAIPSFPKATLG